MGKQGDRERGKEGSEYYILFMDLILIHDFSIKLFCNLRIYEDHSKVWLKVSYRGSPTSTVSTSTNSNAIGINLVLVEFLWNCNVVKIVLVEIGYVVLTSTNLA